MDTYYFPYGNMKGINKIIYEKYRSKVFLSENHIVNLLMKEYLHKNDDINSMIINNKEALSNILTYIMDTKEQYKVIYSFFDSIVEYIIENNYNSKIYDNDVSRTNLSAHSAMEDELFI